jgi:hypothetical protein
MSHPAPKWDRPAKRPGAIGISSSGGLGGIKPMTGFADNSGSLSPGR